MRHLLAPLIAGVLLLTGCATRGPYAEVVGERISSANAYEEDVLVMGVDGQLELPASKTMMIEPGPRQLLLGTVRSDRRSQDSSGIVPLNAKACLRYFFVARHQSMSAVHPWTLVLKDVQPIPECVARYPAHAPAPLAAPAQATPQR